MVRLSDDNIRIRRKPVGSGSNRNSNSPPRISQLVPAGPPSPDVDDTPYIRFALDQLTRDEEVRGSRKYTYPGERNLVVELPADRPRSQKTASTHMSPLLQHPPTPERDPSAPLFTNEDIFPLPPVRHPDHYSALASRDGPPQPDVLVPFEEEVPSLFFLPSILRFTLIGIFFLLCLFMLVALLLSGIWSSVHNGLYDYNEFGGSRYFIFEYLPTFFGIFLLLWLFQIQVAIQRIAPFIAMASSSSKLRSEAPLMDYLPTNFLFPKLFYFRAGLPVIGVCMFIFWLQIFTVPLLGSLYNVYFYGATGAGTWRWVAVQGVVWTLFALYFLLSCAILILAFWLWTKSTGLKWDPRSLADIISLLDHSNITRDYAKSEIFTSSKQFRQRLVMRSDYLGYWHTSRRPDDVLYGIGEEGSPIRQYSLEAGKIREKGPVERSSFPPDTPEELAADLESGDEYDRIRYRYLPWYLHPSLVLLWCVAAFVLYLAFLIVSFVNRAVLNGFQPLSPVAPTSAGFSATNFLYSFVPSLIATLLFLAWLSIDYTFRRLQPYVAMSDESGNGAPATHSLLLDYPARLPVSITLAAIAGGDVRIAWFSILSLIAASLPILAGGCFWAQFYVPQQQVRVAVEASGYYALCVFLAIYVFSLPLVFFGLRKRRLPHKCTTLAEQISWLYQSRVVGEREQRAQWGSKTEITTRLVTAATERERSLGGGRFGFGRFIGRDGHMHIGVERIGRGERRPMTERSWRQRGLGSRDIGEEGGRFVRRSDVTAPGRYSSTNARLLEKHTRAGDDMTTARPSEDIGDRSFDHDAIARTESYRFQGFEGTTAGPEYYRNPAMGSGESTAMATPYPELEPRDMLATPFLGTPFEEKMEAGMIPARLRGGNDGYMQVGGKSSAGVGLEAIEEDWERMKNSDG